MVSDMTEYRMGKETSTVRELASLLPKERLNEIRKVNTITEKMRTIIKRGASSPDNIVLIDQFIRDLRLYNVYEALLYVEGYEEQGLYTRGTAVEVFKLVIADKRPVRSTNKGIYR